MEEDEDSRAMQAGTVLQDVEKKVTKAHDLVDNRAAMCEPLFLACCESRGKPDEREQ